MQQTLSERGSPLFGQLQAQLAAFLRLVIKRLRHRRRTAYLAQFKDFDMKIAGFGSNMQPVSAVNLARGLGLMPMGNNAT